MKRLITICAGLLVTLGLLAFPVPVAFENEGPAASSGPTPVGRWKFNDASGTTAADAVGSNPGTLNGTAGPTWGTGPNANGDIVFGAVNTDQYVDFGSSATLKPTAAGTFCCWFKFVAAVGGFEPLMSNSNNGTERNGCCLQVWSGSHVEFEVASGSALNQVIGSTVMSAGNWYFVCGTWDGSKLHLYLNGVEDATSVTQTLTPTPGFNFTIGWDGAHTSGITFKSQIDDAQVFNVAIASADQLAIYNALAQ